ncbi:MAG: sensor histidine kinase [Christensenellales bacterium]
MNMFRSVQLKFMLIPLVVCALLLCVVFSAIFGIAASSSLSNAKDYVSDAQAVPTEKAMNAGFQSRCITVIECADGQIFTSRDDFFAGANLSEFIEAVKSSSSSVIKFSGMHLIVSCRNDSYNEYPVVRYTIYDYSTERSTLNSLTLTLVIVYIFTVLIIFILSYLFSASAVEPMKIAFKKQQELIANASHELKTPLTIAVTNLDLIASEPNKTVMENKKWLDSASYQLNRMNSLVLQMLELSRLEMKGNKLHYDNVNLSELATGTLLSFEAGIYEKNILLTSDIADDLFYECDKIEAEKLMTILLDNAKKYTPMEGEITFTLQKLPKSIKLRVTNSGKGLSKEECENVFERFYKSDHSHKESGNSFGLGLSIAKSIVLSLGGTIRCMSDGMSWTAFEISLPLKQTK